jgi:hypothetical protein
MGAGSQRWWEDPPFANVVPSPDYPARYPGGRPARLYVGGVLVCTGTEAVQLKNAEAINRARGVRAMYLEDTNEKLKQQRVLLDRELGAGNVLGTISDGALLAELARRRLIGVVHPTFSGDVTWWGAPAHDPWQREYLGEWMEAPVRPSVLDQERAYYGQPRCHVAFCEVPARAPARRYCAQHGELERLEAHIEALDAQHVDHREIQRWRVLREDLMRAYVEQINPGAHRTTDTDRGLTATEVVMRRAEANRQLDRILAQLADRFSWPPFEPPRLQCEAKHGVVNCELDAGHRGLHRRGRRTW